MFKEIGSIFAKQLIKSFGVNVFNIIEYNLDKSFEVKGIRKKREEKIGSD